MLGGTIWRLNGTTGRSGGTFERRDRCAKCDRPSTGVTVLQARDAAPSARDAVPSREIAALLVEVTVHLRNVAVSPRDTPLNLPIVAMPLRDVTRPRLPSPPRHLNGPLASRRIAPASARAARDSCASQSHSVAEQRATGPSRDIIFNSRENPGYYTTGPDADSVDS